MTGRPPGGQDRQGASGAARKQGAVVTVLRERSTTAASPGAVARRRAIREILLVAGLFLAYEIGRIIAAGHV
jgi:hypothetical protein